MSVYEYLPKGKKLKGSHVKHCSICKHEKCKEVERDFCLGRPVTHIAKEYKLNRNSVYHHMELRGFAEFRRNNPMARIEWLAEEFAGQVGYRGADVVRMLEDIAKAKGQLGPENQVNINQNIASFGEKLKECSEDEVRKMLEEVRRKINGSRQT